MTRHPPAPSRPLPRNSPGSRVRDVAGRPATPSRTRPGTGIRTPAIAGAFLSPRPLPTPLDHLRDRLLAAALQRNATPSLVPAIRQAAHEAAAIAWLQPFPLLVLPGIFEEKLIATRRRHHQQNLILSRSGEWLGLAS